MIWMFLDMEAPPLFDHLPALWPLAPCPVSSPPLLPNSNSCRVWVASCTRIKGNVRFIVFSFFLFVPLPSVKHARANELQQLGFVEVATNQYKLGRGLLRILPFTLLKCEAGAAQVEDVAHFVVTPEP